MNATQLRSEHDAVLETLSARRSTLHLAHGAVSFFVAGILLAAAVEFFNDYASTDPEYWMTSLGLGVVTLVYSLVRSLQGRSEYQHERVQVARLRELRRALGIDDPSSLLPR